MHIEEYHCVFCPVCDFNLDPQLEQPELRIGPLVFIPVEGGGGLGGGAPQKKRGIWGTATADWSVQLRLGAQTRPKPAPEALLGDRRRY